MIGSNPFATALKDALKQAGESYQQPDLLEGLAKHVRESYSSADSHRRSSGVEREMLRSLRELNSQYDPEDVELLDGIDIYMGLTNLKIRGAKSWVTDILSNAEDQPWTIKATPKPDLSEDAMEVVKQKLMAEFNTYGLTFDMKERAQYLLAAAQKHTDAVAANASERMEKAIKDKLLEGGWRMVFEQFVHDLMVHPAAILKGPVAVRTQELKWNGTELTPVSKLIYKTQRVDPLRIYPSPNSVCPNSGAYIIERMDMDPSELADCMDLPFFEEEAIRAVFSKFPNGHREMLNVDTTTDMLNKTKNDTTDAVDHQYHVLVYYGKVKGEMLLDHSVKGVDPQRMYEAEVWTCADTVIRAILNPHPLGKRPFYVCCFEQVPGAFWGRSMPNLLRDIQRLANSAARSLVRNMSYSAGPIGEVDIDRLAAEEDVENITPYRMYNVTADKYSTTPSPAMRFQIVPSVADQLLRVYEYYAKMADDVSGVPAYVLGNPQVAGAGRTLGGLSLLMGNAAKGIKAIISNVDKYIIEPVVTAYWTMEMMFGTDPSAKGDSQVIARGASGLLQRELSQARAVEVLNMLTPYAQSGLVPPQGLQIVIRDVLRGLGYQADEIVPDPQRRAQITAAAGQQQPMSGAAAPGTPVPSMQPGTPMPRLDGRSAAANTAQASQAPLPGVPQGA